jgi:hypothetical protein
MTDDSDNDNMNNLPISLSQTPPLTNNHFLLPLPGARYAPRTLTFKGGQQELIHFLEVYDHICAHFRVTDKREKCKGIIPYCTPKVARMIARLPSHINGDYRNLISDLHYFLEDEDDFYDISKVESFTRKWRKRKVTSLDQFKRYHRKYLELVGKARGAHKITDEDYNRYFWEGIHHALRQRIEDRMTVSNPFLDVTVPFEMDKVVAAIGGLFNKKRFDQHLRKKSSHDSSESESEEDTYKPKKHISSDSEDEEEKDSDDSDHSRKPINRKKAHPSTHKPIINKEHMAKKAEDAEISRLAYEMSHLDLNDSQYPAKYLELYIAIILKRPSMKDILAKPPSQIFHTPDPGNPPQRNIPPGRSYGPPPKPFPSQTDSLCSGCGRTGHRMVQCSELNTFLNQGTVVRNNYGKLQWPDRSPIYKDRGDTWVQAIGKTVKRTDLVRAELHQPDAGDVYRYVGITQKDEDTSTDDQEGSNWSARSTRGHSTVGAERNPRVNRDTRRQQKATTNSRQRNPPTPHSISNHNCQPQVTNQLTPVDVNPSQFDGNDDSQFLPMNDEWEVKEKPVERPRVIGTSCRKSRAIKKTNPQLKSGRISPEAAPEIIRIPLPVTVENQVDPILEHQIEEKICALMVKKQIGQSNSSDSESEEDIPELIPQETGMEWSQGQPPEGMPSDHNNKDNNQQDKWSSEDTDEEDRHQFSPSQESHQYQGTPNIMESVPTPVRPDVQANYLENIPTEVDDNVWELYDQAEKGQLRKGRDQWEEWMEEQESADIPPDDPSSDEEQSQDLPGSSTMPTAQQPLLCLSPVTEQLRQAGCKSPSRQECKEPQRQLERISQQDMTYNPPKEALLCLSASASLIGSKNCKEQEKEKQTEREGNLENPDQTHPTINVVGGNQDPGEIWPNLIPQEILSSEKRICKSLQSGKDPTKNELQAPNLQEEHSQPGNHTLNEKQEDSELSHDEVKIVLGWLEMFPGSSGKGFHVHPINPETIAVTLIPEFPKLKKWQATDPASQQILELKKKFKGVLTGVSKHTIACAQQVQDSDITACQCRHYTPATLTACQINRVARSIHHEHSGSGYSTYPLTISTPGPTLEKDSAHTPEQQIKGTEAENKRKFNEGAQQGNLHKTKQVWEPDRPQGSEKIYRFGNLLYLLPNMTKSMNAQADGPFVRLLEEVPNWDIVLGLGGICNESKTYPVMSHEETRAETEQLDNIPEIQRGKHSPISQLDDNSIASSLIGTDIATILPPQTSTLTTTLKSGMSVSVSGNNPDQQDDKEDEREGLTIPNRMGCWHQKESEHEHRRTPERPAAQETAAPAGTLNEVSQILKTQGTGETHPVDRIPSEPNAVGPIVAAPERMHSGMGAARKMDQDLATRRLMLKSIIEKRKNGTEGTGPTHHGDRLNEHEEGPTCNRMRTRNPLEMMEIEHDDPLIRIIIEPPEPPELSSDGALAVREMTPFSRRDERDGQTNEQTSATDDKNDAINRHRRNAPSHASKRDVATGLRPPNRQWARHYKRMICYKTDQLAKEKVSETDKPAPESRKDKAGHDAPVKRAPETNDIGPEAPPRHSGGAEM